MAHARLRKPCPEGAAQEKSGVQKDMFPTFLLVRSLRHITNPLTSFENLPVSPTENQRVWSRLISTL